MLQEEVKDEISVLVRSGFYERDRIIEIVCEEMYEPGEQDATTVTAAVESELAALEKAKASWPEVTDCDRLERAFFSLNELGIIALHNAGYTQSDGYDDFLSEYDQHSDKSRIIGYCFYHGQDVERAVREGRLHLAFGPVDPKDEDAVGPKIGATIREELERVGLTVQWKGTFADRLSLPTFCWQKR